MTSIPAQHDEPAHHCHNCGAAVSYHYCALCGQETTLHVPSAGEFIHEFVGHYIALEGRLWKTLLFLLFKPGLLTAEYIAGRRVRYVQPLRVYLTFSILFFAMLKLFGPPVVLLGAPAPVKPAMSSVATTMPGKPDLAERAKAAPVADDDRLMLTGLPTVVQAKLDAFNTRPKAEREKMLVAIFYSYVPYAMFCLMPLFAAYLKVLYLGSGRRYGEHLLFALHANAFAFAMFSIVILTRYLHSSLIVFLITLWLILYLPKAMQRVYGGARWSTGLRWAMLSTLHVLSIGAAIIAAFGLAVLV